jgi:hypothetical protein
VEKLFLTGKAKDILNHTSKWTQFLAILGFIGTAIGLLSIAIFVSISDSYVVLISLPIFAILITTLVAAVFLNNFSNEARDALRNDDPKLLELSLGNLNATFKTYGIFGIVAAVMSLIGTGIAITHGHWF